MKLVTVYSQPGCYPCKMTTKTLDNLNVEYTVVDISEDHDARDYVMSLGHQTTPVVVTASDNWSGLRLDRLKALAG